MNLYLWNRIDKCTGNYHPEGGVVVIAETAEEARKLFKLKQKYNSWGGYTNCEIRADEIPDLIVTLCDNVKKEVFIFPDAGCC